MVQFVYGDEALPLFVVQSDGAIVPFDAKLPPVPGKGQSLVGLVPAGDPR